jgi:excisionase family DNA binding protein
MVFRDTTSMKISDESKAGAIVERLLLRPAEAAEALGVSRSRAYELIAAGELPSVRVGGSVRVPVAELRRWIAARTKGSAF